MNYIIALFLCTANFECKVVSDATQITKEKCKAVAQQVNESDEVAKAYPNTLIACLPVKQFIEVEGRYK